MADNELAQLIEEYIACFAEGPPIFGMEEDEAISKLRRAIETGKPIQDTPDKHIPDNAVL